MRAIVLFLAAATATAGIAAAGEIYVTRDAKGNLVYTDKPQALPAQKANVRSSSTDPAEVEARQAEQMKRYAADDETRTQAAAAAADSRKAATLSVEDRAKRCADARQRYEAVMQSHRLFEESPDGQRRYLESSEIDAARADAKKVMDEFCRDQ
jgi:hypothetical protein